MIDLKHYIRMARPDHWVKNIFLLPGVAIAIIETGSLANYSFLSLCIGFVASNLMASANYVINEFLDAEFDAHHPTKRNRPAARQKISGKGVFIEYSALIFFGLVLAAAINKKFFMSLCALGISGLLYNVKPFRLKDIPYIDVLFESLNFVIRLLLGWFTVTDVLLPPLSLMLAFWMAGSFLMASKRLAEYRQIGSHETASKYRKSFRSYSERKLLKSSFFYAINFAFLFGIFLFKYRVEYILTFPMFSALFVWYFGLTMKADSHVRDPENLYKERSLMLFIALIIMSLVALSFVEFPLIRNLIRQAYYR